MTKAAKLMGLWERGAAHTALQVISAKPDFPSVLGLFLAAACIYLMTRILGLSRGYPWAAKTHVIRE